MVGMDAVIGSALEFGNGHAFLPPFKGADHPQQFAQRDPTRLTIGWSPSLCHGFSPIGCSSQCHAVSMKGCRQDQQIRRFLAGFALHATPHGLQELAGILKIADPMQGMARVGPLQSLGGRDLIVHLERRWCWGLGLDRLHGVSIPS